MLVERGYEEWNRVFVTRSRNVVSPVWCRFRLSIAMLVDLLGVEHRLGSS